MSANPLTDVVRAAARPLAGVREDYDALLDFIGDARFVSLGEASHGTEEFYRVRAEITKRLIEEREFAAGAVEADFPDALRVTIFMRAERAKIKTLMKRSAVSSVSRRGCGATQSFSNSSSG